MQWVDTRTRDNGVKEAQLRAVQGQLAQAREAGGVQQFLELLRQIEVWLRHPPTQELTCCVVSKCSFLLFIHQISIGITNHISCYLDDLVRLLWKLRNRFF